jgi:predicted transcriptional regulator
MDIQALKLDLVEKIIQIEKPAILIKIKNLIQTEKSEDWWDKLPGEVQQSIIEGLKDVKEGNLFSHENVISEAKQKYGF